MTKRLVTGGAPAIVAVMIGLGASLAAAPAPAPPVPPAPTVPPAPPAPTAPIAPVPPTDYSQKITLPPRVEPPATTPWPPAKLPPQTSIAGVDFSGEYATKFGTFTVLEGDWGAVVSYEGTFDIGALEPHVCGCESPATRTGPDRIVIGSDPSKPSAILELKGKNLVLSPGGDMPWDCCGAEWPGEKFKRASGKKPKTCTVKAAKATLQPPDDTDASADKPAPLRAPVAAGDKVEVVASAASSVHDKGGQVIARSLSPGLRAVGLVKARALDCRKKK